jgi:hypothetical protein
MKNLHKKNLLAIALCFIVILGYGITSNKHFATVIESDKTKKTTPDTVGYLEVIGKFDYSVRNFTGFYDVKLIMDNTVIATQTLSIKKGFGFILEKDKFYTIKIEKEGYISRIFSISTKVDGRLDVRNTYLFSFETSLLHEDLSGLFEDDNIDFPFALISYNKNCDCFEHSKDYTASLIRSMIHNIIYGI